MEETRQELIDRLIRDQNVKVTVVKMERYDAEITDPMILMNMVSINKLRRNPVKRASSNARARAADYAKRKAAAKKKRR